MTQLFLIVAVLLVLAATVTGASYVFAITAEPDREPDPRRHAGSLH